jgi:hypothetical protein
MSSVNVQTRIGAAPIAEYKNLDRGHTRCDEALYRRRTDPTVHRQVRMTRRSGSFVASRHLTRRAGGRRRQCFNL